MKYFSVTELCKSSTASKYGLKNVPDTNSKIHMIELIENLLDPLREKWAEYCKRLNLGTPAIGVNSGYRSPQVNKIVGGVSTSAHMFGYAADIRPLNGQQRAFERFVSTIFAKQPEIKFDQIIIESNKKTRWVHVAYKNSKGKQRMQCFSLKV